MSNPRIPRKPGQPANSKKHSDLYTDENPKGTIHGLGFKDVATAKASVSKIRNSSRSHAHKIQAAVAMEQRAREMGKTSEAAVYRKFINMMKKKTKEMNEEVKKCPPGQYYCFTDKKCKKIPMGYHVGGRGMLEPDSETKKNGKKNGNGSNGNGSVSNGNGNGNGGNGSGSGNGGSNGGGMGEEVVHEGGSLHNWFKGSKSKDGKPGWVQSDGSPCANEPGETKTPKCYSSKRLAALKRKGKKGENIIKSADRRKREKDPGQQSKSGAAKPTNVKTFAKGKKDKNYVKPEPGLKEMTEFTTLPLEIEIPSNIRDFNLGLMFRESLDFNKGMFFVFEEVGEKSFYMKETKIPLDIAFITKEGVIDCIKELEPYDETPVSSDSEVLYALEVNRGWFAENNVEVGDEISVQLSEAQKDRKGKGSGTKDACYHKVKSRYSVWPSAYASGALVKCRKVGAANWGNKSEEYNFDEAKNPIKKKMGTPPVKGNPSEYIKDTNMMPGSGIPKKLADEYVAEKCWKGYEKKGMKTMFGKRYPNCVKKEEIEMEATEDSLRDRRQERGGVDGNVDYRRAPKPANTAGKKKPSGMSALDFVKADIRKKYGDKAIIDTKKKKEVSEAVRLPAKTGNLVDTYFMYRGRYFALKMFFPQTTMPRRSDVEAQIEKVYPGARLATFKVSTYEPGQPVLHAEESRGDGNSIKETLAVDSRTSAEVAEKTEVTEGAAWTKKSGKNPEGGLNEKGRKSYERENPGSDLKAPSKKVGNKRRASFCARMKGMKKKLTSKKTANDPDSRINKSLRAWNC